MIYSLTGKPQYIGENLISISCGPISFEVCCSSRTLSQISGQSETTILTFLQVKEDEMNLFGFCDKEEKEMFTKLISVSGIGPKMAIAILSGITLENLMSAIKTSNVKILCQVKGLGKKTAERLCLELKDKLELASAGLFENQTVYTKSVESEDAVAVLESLGYSRSEASSAVSSVYREGLTAEELVALSLKSMK